MNKLKRTALKIFISIVDVILISNLCFAQATHKQSVWKWDGPNSAASTLSSAFGSASTTGNLIVAHISYSGQTVQVSTVTDNKGNTYSKINGPTNWGGVNYYRSELWYAYNITAGVTLTVTVTLTGAPPLSGDGTLRFIQLYTSEFSGIGSTDPLDQKSVAIGATVPFNSGSAIINYSNELIYGAAIGGTLGAITNGATFTSISAGNSNQIEFKNVATAGTYNADFNSGSNGTYVAEMATFKTTGSVLPIQLIDFESSILENGKVKLDWATASELNFDHFDLEKSTDGLSFISIGRVKGSGTTNERHDYSFDDDFPLIGKNYYRLTSVDFDNYRETFKVIVQNYSGEKDFQISPNPSTGRTINLNFNFQNDEGQVAIYDAMGSIVDSVKINETGEVSFTNTLKNGIYFAKYSSPSFTKAIRFLVQQ